MTTIKSVEKTITTYYIAQDGSHFNNEKECLEYERWCELNYTIQTYLSKGVGECIQSINPMLDKVAKLLNLYDSYENEQGKWYCFRPLDEEDIDFIKKWLEFKSLDDRKHFISGYCIHNKIENFKLDKPYIIVKQLNDIYVTSYEEISDKLQNIIKNELYELDEKIKSVDYLHFSEKRNKLKIKGK